MDKENLNKKNHFWLFKLKKAELENQVENYYTLKITKSYRGIVTLIFSILVLPGFLLLLAAKVLPLAGVIIMLAIFIPIIIFIYKGHRWAIITLIILYTMDKGISFYDGLHGDGTPLITVIVWLFIMNFLLKALQVENERIRIKKQKIS